MMRCKYAVELVFDEEDGLVKGVRRDRSGGGGRRRRDLDRPCPQITLPSVTVPNKTVMKIDRSRARTQSGSAIWAETLRLDGTAIHEAPATRLTAIAAMGDPTMAKTTTLRRSSEFASTTPRLEADRAASLAPTPFDAC